MRVRHDMVTQGTVDGRAPVWQLCNGGAAETLSGRFVAQRVTLGTELGVCFEANREVVVTDRLWPVCDYPPMGAFNAIKLCRSQPPADCE